jgi:beta-1,4-mannosyl-glycoprotein beta-1,4-N-acetylglucosaminyltransferase
MFGGYDLDILEIRFNILDPFVDYFVLGESRQTFSGKWKPMHYANNKDRFAKWKDKIIRVIPPLLTTEDPFVRAGFQKEYLKNGLDEAGDEDIVYFGDTDEIWKPKKVSVLEEYYGDNVYNLRQLNYCYYLNQRSREEWIGTIVGKWKTVKTNSFNHWRANKNNVLDDGGWHFTNAYDVEGIKNKLDYYDHQEFNTEEIKFALRQRMEFGEDYVGRSTDHLGHRFEFWLEEENLPQYILDNKEKYGHIFKS